MQIEGTEGPIIITEGAMGSTDEAEVTDPILTEDNLRQVLQKPTSANTLKDVLKIVEGNFDLTKCTHGRVCRPIDGNGVYFPEERLTLLRSRQF